MIALQYSCDENLENALKPIEKNCMQLYLIWKQLHEIEHKQMPSNSFGLYT